MKEYFCDIAAVSAQEFEGWYFEMSPERRNKCDRMTKKLAKKQCIAADHLAKVALSEALNVPPTAVEILVSPSGKPYVEGNPVYFSLSHSENVVACVVADRPVGIDVEVIRPIKPSIQERICTDHELVYLRASENPEERNLRFLTLWTRKEAVFKRNGILPRKDRQQNVLSPSDGVVFQTRVEDGYVISVAG
ncbi:MAG: 4'-phosphopantetheinyl transferase superfamily protein [Clostridia bacterium]|nr:4'-phosphopantetheinyl transferase superfamily protein [Clostridia bacterium]